MNNLHLNGFLCEGFLGEEPPTSTTDAPPPSPIDGKPKRTAKRRVFDIIGDHKGMFRDEAWEHVHEIFGRMQNAGLNVSFGTINDREHSGGYYRNDRGNIAGKIWEFTVDYINERGLPSEITGQVIASFGGTVEQMENDDLRDRPYDLCVVFTN